jgi:hypothetical protein
MRRAATHAGGLGPHLAVVACLAVVAAAILAAWRHPGLEAALLVLASFCS